MPSTETNPAPTLDATLSRLLRRDRARRRKAIAVRWSTAVAATVAVLAAWRIHDWIEGRTPPTYAFCAALIAIVVFTGAAFMVMVPLPTEETTAREVDRRLALDDRTATALAVRRGRATGGLADLAVRDADETLLLRSEELDAAFPDRVRGPTWKRATFAWLVAFACLAAAWLADFLTFHGPLPLLPFGYPQPGGGEQREGEPPGKGAPRREGDGPESRPEANKPPEPDAKPDPKKPPERKPKGDVRVSVKMSKQEFGDGEPVTAQVSVTPTGDGVPARRYDVRVEVDASDVDTGASLRIDPATPEGDRTDVDLRKVPTLKLPPGEHTLRARLTTRDSLEEHWSEPVKFRIVPPKDDKGGGGKSGDEKKPKEQPKQSPEQQPKPREKSPPPEPKKGEGRPAPPPPPPAAFDRHVVVPLFRDGEEVDKKGLVLVLDPAGGTGAPTAKRPLAEALGDARRRAEEAVDSSRVPAEDRELVRRYFAFLESLRK